MKSQRIIFFLIALTSLLYSNSKYTVTTYFEPLRYDEANGGYMIRDTERAIMRFIPTDKENNKEIQSIYSELPLASYWKVGRNSLGMKPDYSKCGEDPKSPKYTIEMGDEKWEQEYKEYQKTRAEYEECTSNVTQTFDSQTKYKYYYARMPENHLVDYPKKSDLYYRWNLSFYVGGVNDLKLKAVPDEYKNRLEQLRVHNCHTWGGIDNTCYDLPNGDKNIYYALREELYVKDENGKQEPNRYLMDVRVSEPLKWIQIDGIEINQEIYEYIDKTCKESFFCHLNNYTGTLSQEQKDYVEKVKWSKDKVWKEEIKKESKGSSNPWR